MSFASRSLLIVLSAGAYSLLAYATPRTSFGLLLGLVAVAFGAYVGLVKSELPLRQGLVLALLLRLLWLPALPQLSDDYHRFRWDGTLVTHGLNPFQFRPDELIDKAVEPQTTTSTGAVPPAVLEQLRNWYPRLNSPHYYSVYPPVCQAVFGLAATLFPTSEQGFVVVLRLVILLVETASAALLLALLRRFGLPQQQALWYLLNPLVILELTGNVHFEALVICFLLLVFWLLARGQRAAAGGALALAVATKLLPLLLLPLLLRRLSWRGLALFVVALGAGLVVLFAPFLSAELGRHIGNSLSLYFRSFEFNASFYYLLRAVGQWLKGYNTIASLGPALGLATAAGGLAIAFLERRPSWASLPRALLLLLTLYFLLATTVHPWYIAPLVMLSVFTRLRYALVWSGVVGLSYAAYQTSTYTENLWLVGLEYMVVLGVLGLDWRQGRFSLRRPDQVP
ncbi:glycosyltransferase 87 family protein [Hymenobacter seoulensis]